MLERIVLGGQQCDEEVLPRDKVILLKKRVEWQIGFGLQTRIVKHGEEVAILLVNAMNASDGKERKASWIPLSNYAQPYRGMKSPEAAVLVDANYQWCVSCPGE